MASYGTLSASGEIEMVEGGTHGREEKRPLTGKPSSSENHDHLSDIYGRPKYQENASWAQLRRIFKFLGPEIKLVGVATLAGFAGTVLSLVAPQYSGEFFDSIISIRTECMFLNSGECDISQTMHALIMLVTFSLVGLVISNIGSFMFSLAGRRVIARARKELFDAYLFQDLFFFGVKGVGELISRIGPDVSQIEGVTTAFASLLNSSVTLIGSLIMILLINPSLSIIVLSAFPAYSVISYVGGRLLSRLNFICNNLLADQAGYATDILQKIETVKAHTQEEREGLVFSTFTDRVYRLAVRIFVAGQALSSIENLIGLLCRVLVFWLGATEVVTQRMTLGQLIAFQTYAGMVTGAFNEIAGLYSGLLAMIGGSQVIVALLDSFKLQEIYKSQFPPIVAQQIGVERRGRAEERLRKLPVTIQDLVISNVSFNYPNAPEINVLSNFSACLSANSFVAIVGPSGGGKTSLFSLLLRFYEPILGSIQYGGIDIKDFNIKIWRAGISLVTQEPVLLSGTVAENIAYDAAIDMVRVEAAARAAGAVEFISNLNRGFDTRLGHLSSGQALSGGQKQRIAIARALYRNPKILLLDEPTSALDKENENLISATVERLRADRLVVMITHHLDIIKQADNIIVTLRGTVSEQGTHTELLEKRGDYWQFYSHAVAAERQS